MRTSAKLEGPSAQIDLLTGVTVRWREWRYHRTSASLKEVSVLRKWVEALVAKETESEGVLFEVYLKFLL